MLTIVWKENDKKWKEVIEELPVSYGIDFQIPEEIKPPFKAYVTLDGSNIEYAVYVKDILPRTEKPKFSRTTKGIMHVLLIEKVENVKLNVKEIEPVGKKPGTKVQKILLINIEEETPKIPIKFREMDEIEKSILEILKDKNTTLPDLIIQELASRSKKFK